MMLKIFIFSAVLSVLYGSGAFGALSDLIELISIRRQLKKMGEPVDPIHFTNAPRAWCDNDCYDCKYYGVDCAGNDDDYVMFEEDDDEYFETFS